VISMTPMAGKPAHDLPRVTSLPFTPTSTARKLEGKSPREQLRQIEGTLQKLAAASRMQ